MPAPQESPLRCCGAGSQPAHEPMSRVQHRPSGPPAASQRRALWCGRPARRKPWCLGTIGHCPDAGQSFPELRPSGPPSASQRRALWCGRPARRKPWCLGTIGHCPDAGQSFPELRPSGPPSASQRRALWCGRPARRKPWCLGAIGHCPDAGQSFAELRPSGPPSASQRRTGSAVDGAERGELRPRCPHAGGLMAGRERCTGSSSPWSARYDTVRKAQRRRMV